MVLPCGVRVVTGVVPATVTTGTSPCALSGAAWKASCSGSIAAITTLAHEANSRTPPSSFGA